MHIVSQSENIKINMYKWCMQQLFKPWFYKLIVDKTKDYVMLWNDALLFVLYFCQ